MVSHSPSGRTVRVFPSAASAMPQRHRPSSSVRSSTPPPQTFVRHLNHPPFFRMLFYIVSPGNNIYINYMLTVISCQCFHKPDLMFLCGNSVSFFVPSFMNRRQIRKAAWGFTMQKTPDEEQIFVWRLLMHRLMHGGGAGPASALQRRKGPSAPATGPGCWHRRFWGAWPSVQGCWSGSQGCCVHRPPW